MKRIYRKIIFYGFFLAFLVLAPIAIMFALGYRYDSQRKIIVHSGSLTLKGTPTNFNISLNGESKSQNSFEIINNASIINGLRPGTYDVSVTSPGYTQWSKLFTVHSGLSTEFWNILLIKNEPDVLNFNASGTRRFFPSASNDMAILLSSADNSLQLTLLEMESNTKTELFSLSNSSFPDSFDENVEWRTDEKTIAVPIERSGVKDYAIIDLEASTQPRFLSELLGLAENESVKSARWSSRKKSEIYCMIKTGEYFRLITLNIADGNIKRLDEDILAFDVSSQFIYVINKNGIIYRFSSELEFQKQITSIELLAEEKKLPRKIIVYDDQRIAILDEEGGLYLFNEGTDSFYQKIAERINAMQFSDDGKKLLYWSSNEISVYFTRDWDVQPKRKENEIQQISRFSTNIGNVFWYRDYEHIFFTHEGKIKIIELDDRDRRITMNVYSLNTNSLLPATYDAPHRNYFFIDNKNEELNLFLMKIPDTTSIFGN